MTSWLRVRRWSNLSVLAATGVTFMLAPLVWAWLRGWAEVGAPADTSDTPYHVGQLVQALDQHESPWTGMPVSSGGVHAPPDCGFPTPRMSTLDWAAGYGALVNITEGRESHVSDVRSQILAEQLSPPMVTLYEECISNSFLAPLCARRVGAILLSGRLKAERENAEVVRMQKAESKQLLCTYIAGVTARSSDRQSQDEIR